MSRRLRRAVLTALAARDPSSLPLAPNVKFTENGAQLPIGEGFWKTPTTLVTRRDVFADATSGQVALWACSMRAARRSFCRCG